MNPTRHFLLILTAACAATLSGCAWTEQEPDEVADTLLKGMSGQGTVSSDSSSDPSSWEHRN